MNQFLMIFNMEDNHVGIKKLKKTAFPIINLYKEWQKWNLKEDGSCIFKIIGIIVLILIILAIIFLIYRMIRKKSNDSKALEEVNPQDIVY